MGKMNELLIVYMGFFLGVVIWFLLLVWLCVIFICDLLILFFNINFIVGGGGSGVILSMFGGGFVCIVLIGGGVLGFLDGWLWICM